MKLYEFEAKELLKSVGITVPKSQLVTSSNEKIELPGKIIGKSQVLSGSRGKSGLITPNFKSLFQKKGVEKVLVEEFVESETLYYLSLTYSTKTRTPIILFSSHGGVEIESVKQIYKYEINLNNEKLPNIPEVTPILTKLWSLFKKTDARLIEINPLAKTKTKLIALDAKIILDDDALTRHEELNFEPRSVLGKKPSQREILAKQIDEGDHRGSAGSSYIDLDGDIGVIAAGGGGSVVCMDSLIALGGKPANYTEHSGNPPSEKVEKLTEIVLSKPNLKGLWFVGATANFTDMMETLTGFVNGLRKVKPKFPIVIRRGGPRWEEAKAMLGKVKQAEGFDFHIYGPETPMTSTAKILVSLVKKYKKNNSS